MDNHLHSLDLHFHLPRVNKVDAARPFQWLAKGWADLASSPGTSLAYGLLFAVAGYLILAFTAHRPYLFTASVASFFLMGPLAAAGLYEVSRRRAEGRDTTLAESFAGILRHGESIAYFGLFLALVTVSFERISAILFALLYRAGAPDMGNFLADVFLSGEHWGFVAAYGLAGFVVAVVVFALMAFAIPHSLDKGTDNITAAMASVRAVSNNLRAMALWASLIVALMGFGLATWMLAMVFVVPLLGHATWHAYRDVIAQEN